MVLENGYAGDIAIDDFRVFDGNCYTERVSVTYDRKARIPRKPPPESEDYHTATIPTYTEDSNPDNDS